MLGMAWLVHAFEPKSHHFQTISQGPDARVRVHAGSCESFCHLTYIVFSGVGRCRSRGVRSCLPLTARQMVIRAAQRLDVLTGFAVLQFPAAYMVALILGILVEALTDTPREEARFTCHLFAGMAVIGLLVMAPEAITFDFTTLCALVILLRAFYDVSATYAHSVELVCGWGTVAAMGCALTTSNGYPTIMLLLFCSSRNLALRLAPDVPTFLRLALRVSRKKIISQNRSLVVFPGFYSCFQLLPPKPL